jgi:hypothetical protein
LQLQFHQTALHSESSRNGKIGSICLWSDTTFAVLRALNMRLAHIGEKSPLLIMLQ